MFICILGSAFHFRTKRFAHLDFLTNIKKHMQKLLAGQEKSLCLPKSKKVIPSVSLEQEFNPISYGILRFNLLLRAPKSIPQKPILRYTNQNEIWYKQYYCSIAVCMPNFESLTFLFPEI